MEFYLIEIFVIKHYFCFEIKIFIKFFAGLTPYKWKLNVEGSASALSPSLMLEALRFTNQLFEHDPFARDLILAGRRTLGRRRLSSSSLEPFQKKFKVSAESSISAGLWMQIYFISYIEIKDFMSFFSNGSVVIWKCLL